MGKLAVRLAALEKKHAPAERPWWEAHTIEDTQRCVGEALRRGVEKQRAEAMLTPSERLALRRKELAKLETSPVPNHPLRATMELCQRVRRGFLLDEIGEGERGLAAQIATER